MESMHFTQEELDAGIKESKESHFASSLSFLNAHNGLRKGSVHLVIGTASGGKSTLVRTLIRDLLFKKENLKHSISVWLSEETCKEYKTQLMYGMPVSEELKRGALISEEEHSQESFDFFLDHQKIINPSVLIYDNMTTSRFYDGQTPAQQRSVFSKLKAITKELNCATIVIAHTGAEVSDGMDRLIVPNDIRGAKSPVNGTEFLYILQRFKDESGQFYPTVRTTKHRGQDLVHDLYFLHYMKELRAFVKDSPLEFSKFKELYASRQKFK